MFGDPERRPSSLFVKVEIHSQKIKMYNVTISGAWAKESSLDWHCTSIRLLDAMCTITTRHNESIRVGVANLVPTFLRT